MGGEATKFLSKYTSKWNAANIWKNVGAEAKMGTYGRLASMASRNERLQNFAANWKVGELALKGVRSVASDYNKKTDEQVKKKTEFAESLGYNQRDMNAAQLRLRTAQSNLASAKARGVTGAALDPYEDAVGTAKRAASQVETRRKEAYAHRISHKTAGLVGSTDTLLTMVGRRDKLAAAKIQIPVIEKQLTQRKESLKETQNEIKQLTAAIRNNPVPAGSLPGTVVQTPAQTAELTRLQIEEQHKLFGISSRTPGTPTAPAPGSVNYLEQQLDTLKLLK